MHSHSDDDRTSGHAFPGDTDVASLASDAVQRVLFEHEPAYRAFLRRARLRTDTSDELAVGADGVLHLLVGGIGRPWPVLVTEAFTRCDATLHAPSARRARRGSWVSSSTNLRCPWCPAGSDPECVEPRKYPLLPPVMMSELTRRSAADTRRVIATRFTKDRASNRSDVASIAVEFVEVQLLQLASRLAVAMGERLVAELLGDTAHREYASGPASPVCRVVGFDDWIEILRPALRRRSSSLYADGGVRAEVASGAEGPSSPSGRGVARTVELVEVSGSDAVQAASASGVGSL